MYDDFDAIMAAAWLLSDSGAGRSLDFGAWWAAYSYYGHDLFGVTYASQVLARAVAWQRDGFCPNCAVDEGLVDRFDDAHGASVRRALTGERRSTKDKQRKQRRRRKGDRRDQRRDRKRRDGGSKDRADRRSRAHPRPSTPPRTDKDAPTRFEPPPPTPTPPPTPPPTPTPPSTTPAPAGCSPIQRLLGCGR